MASGNKNLDDNTGALELTQMNEMDAKINVNNSEKKEEKGNDEEFERALDSERIDDFKVDSTREKSKSIK